VSSFKAIGLEPGKGFDAKALDARYDARLPQNCPTTALCRISPH
jgi:hypothetical protein